MTSLFPTQRSADRGRRPTVGLARRVVFSAPPFLRRVRARETPGFIRGYHAALDAERLGYEVMFHALVGLDSQSEAVLGEFERQMGEWPEVRRCDMVRGSADFILRVVARNTAHENELTTRLTGVPHVSNVQTFQVIRTAKDRARVPVAEPD